MKSHPIAAHQANEAIALRYNLFRHKWQPDLCCAVPEHHPVPSFVTGEQWDFEGTWVGPIFPPGLKPTAVEPDLCVAGFHLFRVTGPRGRLTMPEHPAAGGPWRAIARRELRIAAP